MMMMTSYEAPGYGATTTPGYLDQHQYAWQFAGLSGYQRLQQQQYQHLQQQQHQQQQFEQQRLQQPASQHAVNVTEQYYPGKYTQNFIQLYTAT